MSELENLPVDERHILQRLERELEAAKQEIRLLHIELSETNAGLMAMHKELEGKTVELENKTGELEKKNAALEAANHELEAFAYSVSHDLRSPLGHIGSFVGLLEKHSGASLDEEGRQFMRCIRDSTHRLSVLIDHLLKFFRLGRASLVLGPTHVGRLLEEVLRDFEFETRGRRIEWTIHELPVVEADPSLLRLALMNLISNAIKYSRGRDPARIEVGCLSGGSDERVVFVRDNGVGFNMRHKDRLFKVFQRLHGAAEFDGIGIGLANVHRIVVRHGGRVWAESQEGGGACFYLALPAKPLSP